MAAEASSIRISDVQDALMEALPVVRDELATLLDDPPWGVPAVGTIRRLVSYQAQRGQAVLHLATSGMPWDAEIVLRSFYEASFRILFLALAEPSEREQLDKEYWEVLGAMAERRRALKVNASGADSWEDPRSAAILDVFRDPALFAIEPTGTKSSRKAVDQKWSFSEIATFLSKMERDDVRGLSKLADYLHPYALASHLIHADGMALELLRDRTTRGPGEASMLAAAHVCRIFTDVVGLQCFCAEAIRSMLKREFVDREKMYKLVWRCMELSSAITSAFYDTQADFYRRHGRTEFNPPERDSEAG